MNIEDIIALDYPIDIEYEFIYAVNGLATSLSNANLELEAGQGFVWIPRHVSEWARAKGYCYDDGPYGEKITQLGIDFYTLMKL